MTGARAVALSTEPHHLFRPFIPDIINRDSSRKYVCAMINIHTCRDDERRASSRNTSIALIRGSITETSDSESRIAINGLAV